MTVEKIREHALGLPGTTEDVKWENNLCFSVGGKLYLITNPDDFPVSVSLKADEEQFEELIASEGIIPAPYLARNKWVMVKDISRIDNQVLVKLVEISYQLVFEKLSRKVKDSIHQR